MPIRQAPRVPPKGQLPAPVDWLWVLPMALIAIFRLVRARIKFAYLPIRNLLKQNRKIGEKLRDETEASASEVVFAHRIAYILPRVAQRMPFRSDCLIQAIAGQDWLAFRGFASEIIIGVKPPDNQWLEAHAWLEFGKIAITGGEIEPYAPIGQSSKE